MQEIQNELTQIITLALAEDLGTGDVTSRLTIPENLEGEMLFVARHDLVVCGTFIPETVYHKINHSIRVQVRVKEGERVAKGTVLAVAHGKARDLLSGERVALNLMQRATGVATLTRRYVDAIAGTRAIIIDTRKTIPGLRLLDKYAVRTGGGSNHRMGLYDMVLIKDNHIAVCGGITQAIAKARAGTKLPIEVECDTLEQVKEAIAAKPDRILIDNMSLADMRTAVKLTAGAIPLEASGSVSLDNVRDVAATGVDFISVGKLTHSAPAADIGADMALRKA